MRQVICTLVLAVAAGPLAAAELSTLATLAVQDPVQALEKAYQRPGQAIKVQFDTSRISRSASRRARGPTC